MNTQLSWRCLLIEDDADNARYIADSFGAQGHAVVVCPQGAQGMQRATREDWDIVILDRMLADGMDGLAILRAMREAGKKTPVLVLSALASLDERVRGLRAGGDDYLTKPLRDARTPGPGPGAGAAFARAAQPHAAAGRRHHGRSGDAARRACGPGDPAAAARIPPARLPDDARGPVADAHHAARSGVGTIASIRRPT